jgi:hypothetical protein
MPRLSELAACAAILLEIAQAPLDMAMSGSKIKLCKGNSE